MQTQPVATERPSKFVPALLGGVIMGAFALPILNYVNCLCCAGIMLGGLLGVLFYKNRLTPESPPLTSGDGVAIGALAGVFGAILGTVINVAVMMIATSSMGMMEAFQQFEERGVEMPDFLREMIGDIMLGRVNAILVFFVLIFDFIIYPLFGLLGGLIGAAIFKPKLQQVPPPTPPPTGA